MTPFDDLDGSLLDHARRRPVATIHKPSAPETPYVPRLDPAELARRNRSAVELLDSWEAEGDDQEQRETMQVLREALGKDRTASSRNLFP
jgi:hypothetical protein